jgi:hypothetical protein
MSGHALPLHKFGKTTDVPIFVTDDAWLGAMRPSGLIIYDLFLDDPGHVKTLLSEN